MFSHQHYVVSIFLLWVLLRTNITFTSTCYTPRKLILFINVLSKHLIPTLWQIFLDIMIDQCFSWGNFKKFSVLAWSYFYKDIFALLLCISALGVL